MKGGKVVVLTSLIMVGAIAMLARARGKLKVGKDTNVESLKVCDHCGSEIEALDLADFLKTALS